MTDCMSFPNTMNEFMEQYSFKDTDEVYTNGSELIQVFRVKQGLEHYEAKIRAKAIEEFAEAVRNAYATMQSISEIERATANTIVMGIEAELKGE